MPFNLSSEYGLAIAHYGDYCWLANPSGVWRADLTAQTLDLTGDVTGVREELGEASGTLTVELRNDDGRYTSPGQGSLSVFDIGCQLNFSPGCVTGSGNEVSSGPEFGLEAYEHTSSGGKASLFLYGYDGWNALKIWRARHQFRWNKSSDDMSVKDIIAFVLARAGLKLEVKSQSAAVTGFYPDFTVSTGEHGETIIRKLLSFVPDVLFVEGGKAYLVNPLSSDSSIYSYGDEHGISEGRYLQGALALSRVQVEGDSSGTPVIVSSYKWDEIGRLYDRFKQLEDRNIGSVAEAQQLGEAYLREAEIQSVSGLMVVPVNCGQQLYDVIDITDSRAGMEEEKTRILGLVLVYQPRLGQYNQRLKLGAV